MKTMKKSLKNPKPLLRCDGFCDEHRGVVRPVKCWEPGDDTPWYWNYCDAAIAEDTRRGFIVEEINQTDDNAEIDDEDDAPKTLIKVKNREKCPYCLRSTDECECCDDDVCTDTGDK
jgi:hypothetical protein